MKNMIQEAPDVADAFFAMTRAVKKASPLDERTNELVLVGIFAACRGLRGIVTHVERAREHGATREEIVAAILLALPVVGVTDVNLALDRAIAVLDASAEGNGGEEDH